MLFFIASSATMLAQDGFGSFQEAMTGVRPFYGNSGPGNVNWINEGTAYSFTERGENGAQLIKNP